MRSIILCCAAFIGMGPLVYADSSPPNIIVVLVDDLGWTDLSCQGSGYYQTPNIDRLASRGTRFTQAYAACAVCSPTRAALMTGRYPARVGVTDWLRGEAWKAHRPPEIPGLPGFSGTPQQRLACPVTLEELPLEEVTLAELLKGAGYATCHIGKWHLGDAGHYPEQQGFDENIGGSGLGQPPSFFDPYANAALPGGIPTLKPRKPGEYLTDREADEAVGFIRRHAARPFFLHLAHHAVHTPIEAKEELTRLYKGRARTNHRSPEYAAMIHSVDEAMGRILETLEELNLEERTLVFFTSDNGGLDGLSGGRAGWPTDNAPLRWGKGHPYEGGLRVPLIVRWPGVAGPSPVVETPAITMDLFVTALDAAGVETPKDRAIDGRSLRPVLTGRESEERALFWHFPHYGGDSRVPYSVVRSGAWKLIRYYDTEHVELYNVAEDLGEERNVAGLTPKVVRELSNRLDAWLKETGAKMPRPNPSFGQGG